MFARTKVRACVAPRVARRSFLAFGVKRPMKCVFAEFHSTLAMSLEWFFACANAFASKGLVKVLSEGLWCVLHVGVCFRVGKRAVESIARTTHGEVFAVPCLLACIRSKW